MLLQLRMNRSSEIIPVQSFKAHNAAHRETFSTPEAVTYSYITLNMLVILFNTAHILVLQLNNEMFSKNINHRFFLMVLAIGDLSLGLFRLVASNQLSQSALSHYNWLCVSSQVIIQGLMICLFGLILVVTIHRILAILS